MMGLKLQVLSADLFLISSDLYKMNYENTI